MHGPGKRSAAAGASRIGRRALTSALAVAFVFGLGACDKSGNAASDAGDAAADAKARDASGEGGHASGDGGAVDDLAMPPMVSDELSARMRHLLEAIAQNNSELAGDVLFPRDAYAIVRDAPDPQKAWERRVQGAFRRAVERTHKRTKGAEGAKFVAFELGHAITQLTVKKKDFKKPLWRVKSSKLLFTIDGKQRHVDIAEMTAWRGNWYVTRLR